MNIFKDKTFLLKTGLFLLIFSIFLSFSAYRLDPDFGWHLRTGQLILQTRQIPHVDWYSYTMPNFPWIAHEWLTDIFIYLMYSNFGYLFLSFVFAFIGTTAVYIAASAKKIKYSFIPAVLCALALLPFIGVRPQVITLLFFAIIYILAKKFLWFQNNQIEKRMFWLIPLIFILWVNLHGGFVIGLFLLFLLFLIKLFCYFIGKSKDRHFPSSLLLILLFSILVTFINPYGGHIYREIFSTVFDPFIRRYVNEWLPLFYNVNFFTVFYLGAFIGLLICLYKKFDFLRDLFLPIIFLLLGILSSRNFALFIIISIPLFADFILFVSQLANKQKKENIKNILKSSVTIFILSIGLLCLCARGIAQGMKVQESYPYGAIDYFKSNPIKGNMFNVYDWGGFIICNLPENKVFIDGRMPSWRAENEYVFKEYIEAINNQDKFQDLLKKYNIRYTIVKTKEPENNGIDKWLQNLFNVQSSKKTIKEMIANSGYKVIYQDDIAVILEKD